MSQVKYKLKHGGHVKDFTPHPTEPPPEKEVVTIDNFALLKKAVNHAAKRYSTSILDAPDRREEAFCGFAEKLIEQGDLDFLDAVSAGTRAINRAVELHRKHHGLPRHGEDVSSTGEKFAIFWHPAHIPGISLDHLALPQVFDALTIEDQDALLALASTQDVRQAAELQGVKYSTYCWRLKRARKAALELWFDHETPMKLWPNGRRKKTHCPQGHPYEQYARWTYLKARDLRVRHCSACARIKDKNRDYSKRKGRNSGA